MNTVHRPVRHATSARLRLLLPPHPLPRLPPSRTKQIPDPPPPQAPSAAPPLPLVNPNPQPHPLYLGLRAPAQRAGARTQTLTTSPGVAARTNLRHLRQRHNLPNPHPPVHPFRHPPRAHLPLPLLLHPHPHPTPTPPTSIPPPPRLSHPLPIQDKTDEMAQTMTGSQAQAAATMMTINRARTQRS